MADFQLDDHTVNGQRILIVDDDPAIVKMVKIKLINAGYDVLTAISGEDALNLVTRHGLPHLALIDLNMSGMSGFELCERFQQFSDLPIIILSAIDEEDTVVQSIERYAEDYVVKPFSPRELVVRIQRVLRRVGNFSYTLAPLIMVDNYLSIDFAHQQAILNQQAIPLTATETKLLYILIRNAGQSVTSDFLLRRLWPLDEVYEDTLRVHVYRLRQKIEPVPSKPTYILTQRNIGYSFPLQKA